MGVHPLLNVGWELNPFMPLRQLTRETSITPDKLGPSKMSKVTDIIRVLLTFKVIV